MKRLLVGLLSVCACASPDASPGDATSSARAALVPASPSGSHAPSSPAPSGPLAKTPAHTSVLQWLQAHRQDVRSPGAPVCGKDPKHPGWCEALCTPGGNVLSCAVVYLESNPANARVGVEVPGFVDCGVVGAPFDESPPNAKDRSCTLVEPGLAGIQVRILHEEASRPLQQPERSLIFFVLPGFSGYR
jgi:hypothetical protein